MLLHLVLQRCKDVTPACRCWRTCGYCVQSAAIAVQGIKALLRAGITFVGDIVSSACERVDGRYWLAQRRRAQPGCHRKVFVVGDRRSQDGVWCWVRDIHGGIVA